MKRFSAFLLGILAALSLQVFAAQQTINIGSSANDGTGDTLRQAGQKMNSNFTELYTDLTTVTDRFTGGVLEVAHGGTNLSAAADDSTLVGNGTTWQSKAVPDCDDSAGNHLNYDTATNAFSCGSSAGGSGVSQSTGTFTISWDDACDTTPTTAARYVLTGNMVTLTLSPMSPTNCTSDSTAFQATSTSTVPSGIRPAQTIVIPINNVKNNSITAPGCIGIRTNGTIYVDRVGNAGEICVGTSWTNSGSKWVAGASATSVSYTIN